MKDPRDPQPAPELAPIPTEEPKNLARKKWDDIPDFDACKNVDAAE